MIPKNRGERLSSGYSHSDFFGLDFSGYATAPFIVALSPSQCHNDITKFLPWSTFATGNHLDTAENIPEVAQSTGTVDVFDPRSGIWGPTSRRASVSS